MALSSTLKLYPRSAKYESSRPASSSLGVDRTFLRFQSLACAPPWHTSTNLSTIAVPIADQHAAHATLAAWTPSCVPTSRMGASEPPRFTTTPKPEPFAAARTRTP